MAKCPTCGRRIITRKEVDAILNVKVKRVLRKSLHLIVTFIVGVALATVYHEIVTNKKVIQAAETVCNSFGRDAEDCKSHLGDVLDMSDNEVQNNINIDGGK